MRVLLAHPGCSWSVSDYWRGYHGALTRAGVDLVEYALDNRIVASAGWLRYCWKRIGKPEDRKPSHADYMYQAGVGALERALRHAVDWVLVVSAMYMHPDVLILLRRAGVRTAVMFTECPYDDDNQVRVAALCDVSFVNERSSVARFREVCPQTHYLAHAYDPAIHKPLVVNGDTPAHDVLFVGTGFQERVDLLKAVNWSGVDLGLYGSWELLKGRHRLRQYRRAGVTENEQAVKMYQAAKVNINMHRTSIGFGSNGHIAHAESVNPRVLELAACGAFFISDWRDEMRGTGLQCVPTFTDAESLERECRHWLSVEPDERQWIADQARRAVQGQTFDARVGQVIGALEGAQ